MLIGIEALFGRRAGLSLKSRAYWNEGAKSNHYDNTKLQHFIRSQSVSFTILIKEISFKSNLEISIEMVAYLKTVELFY